MAADSAHLTKLREWLRSPACPPPSAPPSLRVSTDQQTTDNQRPELVALARQRGFTIEAVYDDTASAVKARPAFGQMLLDAHRGKFDVLLVWSLDRLGRSMAGNLQVVLELDRLGVQVVSVRESFLDTSGPVRPLLIAIFGWLAQQERERLIERTKAGLERARRQGKRIGRPRVRVDVTKALALQGDGKSIREIATKLGVGAATLHRALQAEAAAHLHQHRVPA
jgi:DNA invertase Pin-like site-specific DNA recombinase